MNGPEVRTDAWDGFTGCWLRNAHASAFVAVSPYPRVVSFAATDGASPLFVSRDHEYFGVRSWFMEPEQTGQSGLPALQAATVTAQSGEAACLTTPPEPQSGLSLSMELTLLPDRAALRIRHVFTNETQRVRRLAPWSITALDPGFGTGVALWPKGQRRSVIMTKPGVATDPVLTHGPSALAADFSKKPDGAFLKVGVDADCGWGACAGERLALVSFSPFQPGGTYPEGGATVTMFRSGTALGPPWAEIENVGPLQEAGPGDAVEITQVLAFKPGLNGKTIEQWARQVRDD